MKYKLIIEGTKEEIKEAKTREHSIAVYEEGSTICQRWNSKPELEFRIVEPKRRWKTNDELIACRYSETIFRDCGTILIREGVGYFSKGWRRSATDKIDVNSNPEWLDIFTAEVTE